MSVSLNALRGGKRKYTHAKTNSWKQMLSPCNHLSAVKTFCAHPHPNAPTYIEKAVYFSKINLSYFNVQWCCYIDLQQKHCCSFRHLQL